MKDRFKLKCFNRLQNKMYEVRSISYYQGNVVRIEVEDNGKILIFDEYDNNIDNSILVQCTGLKDKNGKLIYEGDIVNVKIDSLKISFIPMVVVWDRKEWQLKQYNKNFKQNCSACEIKTKQKCQYCSQYFSTSGHTNFKEFHNNEVIGNIYENKELLEN